MFTEGGQFIKHISDKHLKTPRNISIGSDSRIITCDFEDKQIQVLSPDGNDLLQSFSAPDCDSFPRCAVYHQDTFFVSYPFADCVKLFNNAGVYQYGISCEGYGDGQLMFPTGLVIDKFNQLIVCDTGNSRLQIFALDDKFVAKITGQHSVNSALCNVAYNKRGSVLVTDSNKNYIYVYH